jgi:hypothetical protein
MLSLRWQARNNLYIVFQAPIPTAPIAQLGERQTEDLKVTSSILVQGKFTFALSLLTTMKTNLF